MRRDIIKEEEDMWHDLPDTGSWIIWTRVNRDTEWQRKKLAIMVCSSLN